MYIINNNLYMTKVKTCDNVPEEEDQGLNHLIYPDLFAASFTSSTEITGGKYNNNNFFLSFHIL